MESSQKICPKCQYIRQSTDSAPPDECPKCGIIYAKAMVSARPGGPKIPAAWLSDDEEEKAVPEFEPMTETTSAPIPPPSPVAINRRLIIDCEACANEISHQAQTCPKCGHPNPDAPRTAGLIAAMIAISLGIDAAVMPYFAAVFLVPATFAAAAVTAILRMRTLAVVALIPAFIGLYNIYQVSKHLSESQAAMERSQSQLMQEAERVQRLIDRQFKEPAN